MKPELTTQTSTHWATLASKVFVQTAVVFGVLAVALAILLPLSPTPSPVVQTTDCPNLITSLPATVSGAGQTYCVDESVATSGPITIGADDVTIDGANTRGGRAITSYLSWRPLMPVTGVIIQGRRNTTIKNLDVNGSISVGQVNQANLASPNTTIQNSTMHALGVSGRGPVRIIGNIIHAPNGTNRVKYIAGIDEPAPGTVERSDYVMYGNAIMIDDTTQTDEPSYSWMYRSPQMIIANNYFYATDASNGHMKDILRLRDDSSFGFIENNHWGIRPPWLAGDTGNGHTNSEASPLHISATADGPAYPRGNVYRNNVFRNTNLAMVTQGWGRGNIFKNNVFVAGGQALRTIPGQPGLSNNLFEKNTFVNFSLNNGTVFVDDTGAGKCIGGPTPGISCNNNGSCGVGGVCASNPNSLTFHNNLVVNTTGSRLFQCDHLGASTLTGTKNMFYGNGSFLSCFEGSQAIKNQNPGFVNATLAENGDFHVTYCVDQYDYRGAYPCNLPGQSSPTKPTNLRATRLPGDRPSGIDLTWGPSRDDGGVTKYIVEKAIGSGPFVQLQTWLGPGIIGPGMVDFEAVNQTQYRYRVRAVDGAGNLSDWSSIVTVGSSGGGGTRRETLE